MYIHLSWYCSIHTGFVIINFFWQIECAVLICIYVIVLYVLWLIHILNNVILFTFLREENVNLSVYFWLGIFFPFRKEEKNKNLTIVQSGTSIVLYKIICTFLSRGILILRPKGNFIAKYIKSVGAFIQTWKPTL